ncbi:VRR-NUC domain-containing protein [Halorussus salinisoli]|uniref:VRR-NUC domain-containing protein n=1 Tax=Halorussus salinisoli TaxID=2558242 RepID=UPI0010C19E64|nr:VRR-NUC domain-containing protein [Halorussus salinisoli]
MTRRRTYPPGEYEYYLKRETNASRNVGFLPRVVRADYEFTREPKTVYPPSEQRERSIIEKKYGRDVADEMPWGADVPTEEKVEWMAEHILREEHVSMRFAAPDANATTPPSRIPDAVIEAVGLDASSSDGDDWQTGARAFTQKGVPDLFVWRNVYDWFFLEVKSWTDGLNANQKDWFGEYNETLPAFSMGIKWPEVD